MLFHAAQQERRCGGPRSAFRATTCAVWFYLEPVARGCCGPDDGSDGKSHFIHTHSADKVGSVIMTRFSWANNSVIFIPPPIVCLGHIAVGHAYSGSRPVRVTRAGLLRCCLTDSKRHAAAAGSSDVGLLGCFHQSIPTTVRQETLSPVLTGWNSVLHQE